MELVSVSPLRVSSVLWQKGPSAWVLTVICKATFDLAPGELALAADQDAINEADEHWNDDVSRSLHAPSDLAPLKLRADVVLVGSAYAPGGVPTRSLVARLIVNKVDKAIECVADRATNGRDIQEGAGFSRMPLVWERATGGPGTVNPVGMRRDGRDAYGRIVLPNLQAPGSRPDAIEPIGFGPIAPRWPQRLEKLGRHAATWSPADVQSRPLPGDIDLAHFNVAPPDQQVPVLRENERIVLENLHREHARLITSLPGLRPCAFVEGRTGAPFRLPMHADTLWIDTDRGQCTVVWRRQLPLDRPDEQGRVVVAMERPGQTLSWAEVAPRLPELAPEEIEPESEKPEALTLPPQAIDPEQTAAAFQVRPASSTLPFLADDGGYARPPAPRPQTLIDAPAMPPKSPQTITFPVGGGRPDGGLPFVSAGPASTPGARLPASPMSTSGPPPGVTWGGAKTASMVAPPPTAVAGAPSRERDSDVFPSGAGATQAPPPPTPMPAPVPMPPAPASVPMPPAPVSAAPPPSAGIDGLPGAPQSFASVPGAPQSFASVPGAPQSFASVPGAPQSFASPWVSGAVAYAAKGPTIAALPAEPLPVLRPEPLPAPAAKTEAPEIFELLWFDGDSVPRMRRHPAWKPILAALERQPVDRDLDDPALADAPMEMEDRREVFEILAHGSPGDLDTIDRALEAAVRKDGKFVPQLALLTGQLAFSFDELSTLKATVATVAPFVVPGDEALKSAVDAAKTFLETADDLTPPSLTESMTARIRTAFAATKRAVPETHLEEQTDRVLLGQRRYQKRIVFGGAHLRCLLRLDDGGSAKQADGAVPSYLPESLAKKLPLFQRFKGRLVVEVQQQADQYETHHAALRVVALARATPRRTRT